MAKRIYSLPRLDQLTKDQRKVLRLKEDGQYLIVGSPGTGKSVVALLRTEKFLDHQFLTFNHVLSEATKQLSENKIKCDTAMSWFYALQWGVMDGMRDTFEQDKMPEIEAHKPDYLAVIERFKNSEKNCSSISLIIDEGQDLPPAWYESLEALEFENFFIVADQNQQITEDHSSRKELQQALGLESQEVIELKDNFRCVAPIAEFANCFYTDKSSPKPRIPNKPTTNVPILFEYDNIDKIKKQILDEYHRDPSKLIGFIVPNDNKREHYIKALKNDPATRHNPPPIISTYSSNQKQKVDIDFSSGGVVILNDKSVKGIEFDIVFIIIDDFKVIAGDIEGLKKRFYVMSSRAKEKLFLFKSTMRSSLLDDVLPRADELSEETGELILKRFNL